MLISPSIRREHNITDYVYLYVTSIFDSTYSLAADADNRGYVSLISFIPEISILEGEEVDNYFFAYAIGMEQIDVEHIFTVKTLEIDGKFNFGVRLCPLQAESDYVKCLVGTREQAVANSKDYSGLRGVFKRTLGITHFTFQQNSRGCLPSVNQTSVYCLYHIIFYRADTSTSDPVKYQVELSQKGSEYLLQENTAVHFRQGEGD